MEGAVPVFLIITGPLSPRYPLPTQGVQDHEARFRNPTQGCNEKQWNHVSLGQDSRREGLAPTVAPRQGCQEPQDDFPGYHRC